MPQRVAQKFWLEAWTAHKLLKFFQHAAPKRCGFTMAALTLAVSEVGATISEKTFGAGEGSQLTSAAVWPKMSEVCPMMWLQMSIVRKSTVLVGQHALHNMRQNVAQE